MKIQKVFSIAKTAIKVGIISYTLGTMGYAGVSYADYVNEIKPIEINFTKQAEIKGTIKEQVWALLDNYGLSLDEKITAVEIINCESKWNEYAINKNRNGTFDVGLWQINDVHKLNRKCSFDMECATKWAIEKYKKEGNWNAWVCNK
jgi:hypothetical protein